MIVTILMPVRNDWVSAAELLRRLESALSPEGFVVDILFVDDGSTQRFEPGMAARGFSTIRSVRILQLRRNVGHQRAIAVGLGYASQNVQCDALMVMDADGEDTAEGALLLLRKFCGIEGRTAVFAERVRRSESLMFRVFYKLYRMIHWLLTGIKVRVGNFSVIPARYLTSVGVLSELWNHYAAAIFNSKLPYSMVPVARGARIDGVSQMNFVSLVAHGLSAISVFGDRIGVRILVTSLACAALTVVGILVAVGIRVFSNLAIPGWATYAIGTLVIMFIQLITMAATFTFFMLSNRINLGFVPMRDYSLFVAEIVDAYHRE